MNENKMDVFICSFFFSFLKWISMVFFFYFFTDNTPFFFSLSFPFIYTCSCRSIDIRFK